MKLSWFELSVTAQYSFVLADQLVGLWGSELEYKVKCITITVTVYGPVGFSSPHTEKNIVIDFQTPLLCCCIRYELVSP